MRDKMRHKRSQSAPVRLKTRKRTSNTPSTATEYPRTSTARTSCSSVAWRRLQSAMSGSGLGSAVDAFSDVSVDTPGVYIWSLEGRRLHLVDFNDHGFFLEGTAYIVLKVSLDRCTSLHYWCGKLATENDVSLIHDLAHELDVSINNASIFTRETQHHESLCFMRLFPEGIVYLEGGPHTSISRTSRYSKRLYVVTGRTHVRAECRKPTLSALNSSRCVILDGVPRVYVWVGSQCCYVTRVKAIQLARRLRTWQRKGKAHVVVIDEKDVDMNSAFLKKLDDDDSIQLSNGVNGLHVVDDNDNIVLHRVSGERVLYDMPFAARKPLHYKYLVSSSSYLLDTGGQRPVYVWVGTRASISDFNNAIVRGQAFAEHQGYSRHTPVCRIQEGHEPLQFRQAFHDWRDQPSQPQSQTKKYSAGNMGRQLFSRSSKRAVPKISAAGLNDSLTEKKSSFMIYVLKGDQLQLVERWDYGTFSISHCYMIDHELSSQDSPTNHVLYFWMGANSTEPDRTLISQICMGAYDQKATLVRVLDGREPVELLNLLGNVMVVFNNEIEKSHMRQMYCVREVSRDTIRVTQVPPVASALNSSAAFVLTSEDECYLWYGRDSGGPEREYAKHFIGCINPNKMYEYDIVTETKETDAFWERLGGKMSFDSSFKIQQLGSREARVLLCSVGGYWDEIIDFNQEDLSDTDLLLLDTFDKIFLWYGAKRKSVERDSFLKTTEEYLEQDQAGRSCCHVELCYVSQGHEPHMFTKYFTNWRADGFGGKEAFDSARKKTRQENARIDIDTDVLDRSHMSKRKYSYSELVKDDLPLDVDYAHKQYHLTDKQFIEVLRVSRFQFVQLPEWKQKQLLQKTHLMPSGKTPMCPSLKLPL